MCASEDVPSWLREHRAPVLLSSLLLTGDDDATLESFARRLPRSRTTPAELRTLRALAVRLCCALLSERPEDWRTVTQAARAARGISRPHPVVEQATTRASDTAPKVPAAPEPALAPPHPAMPRGASDVARSHAAAPSVPAQMSAPPVSRSLDTTGAVDSAALFGSLADNPSGLPFQRAPADAVVRISPEVFDVPHRETGATGEIDSSVLAHVFAGLPEASPASPRLPMAVDQYAALVARTEAFPEARQDAIHEEYGVQGRAHRKRIDEAFAATLSSDSALRDRYQQAYGQWVAWLKSSGER